MASIMFGLEGSHGFSSHMPVSRSSSHLLASSSSNSSSSAAPSPKPNTNAAPPSPRPQPIPQAPPDYAQPPPSSTPPPRKVVPTKTDTDGVKVVPASFEKCDMDDLIALIASMLNRLIQHNDLIPLTSSSLTRFHSRAPPSISISDYLHRITRYTNVEPCCLLILLYYVDRVCESLPTFTISSLTVHRFIIAGVAAGSKALSDQFCTNGRYARVGGVSLAEMNLLEKEFLRCIDWRLTTTGTLLSHYYVSLVRSHASYRLSSATSSPASLSSGSPASLSVPSTSASATAPTMDTDGVPSPSTSASSTAPSPSSHAPSAVARNAMANGQHLQAGDLLMVPEKVPETIEEEGQMELAEVEAEGGTEAFGVKVPVGRTDGIGMNLDEVEEGASATAKGREINGTGTGKGAEVNDVNGFGVGRAREPGDASGSIAGLGGGVASHPKQGGAVPP